MENAGFVIWSEKIPGKGEDAKPTSIVNVDEGKFVLAVYDGMGGAGSALYNYKNEIRSGAYIAANETKNYLEDKINIYLNELNELDSFGDNLFLHLQALVNEIDKNPSRLKSNLIRKLPTTIAAILCCSASKEIRLEEKITCFWAGDSRCYILSPDNGLKQLSIDDLKGGDDALINLRNDSPMSNYCNADTSFIINKKIVTITKPFIVLVATDGCFGYLQSPFHFENILLKTMMSENATDIEQWKEAISCEIQNVTGDDYSMALWAFGFESFTSMQDQFDNRASVINNDFIIKYEIAEKTEFENRLSYEQAVVDKNKLLNELWDKYKTNYQA